MSKAFSDLDAFRRLLQDLPAADPDAVAAATRRNAQLTKPPGALGRLEELAIWYAGWRGTERPAVAAPQIVVFAGNHGVAARGVSAFPPEVTAQMVLNFEHGGAAINQLAKTFGARMDVIALSLETPTADFTEGPAMSESEVVAALHAGWTSVDPATDVLVTGEMGIGNTTAAAALAAALFGGGAGRWTGRGTGLDDAGLEAKRGVVSEALALHGAAGDALETLRRLGGREIAAMAGAIARARHLRIPVLLDGFICCAAAACLARTTEGALDHCIAAHVSAEAAHGEMLAELDLKPLLALELRLGEGSGAAVALGILKAAVACQSDMATFEEAGVAAG